MPNKPLPVRLGKEPLIDAVFEVRFDSSVSAADIMPGFLHTKLKGEVRIERLPIAALPVEVRRGDANLVNQPLVQIFWKNFILVLGDNSFAIACVLPYPGWKKFREVILEMMAFLDEAGIVKTVSRYSHKYVDILEVPPTASAVDWIDMNLVVGGHELTSQAFQVHLELATAPFVHAIHIAARAKAQPLNGAMREGMIVSIDSLIVEELPSFKELLKNFPDRLDRLHVENKQMFFDCLTDQAIVNLEPIYE